MPEFIAPLGQSFLVLTNSSISLFDGESAASEHLLVLDGIDQ
jgi:hypothetical protein